MSTEVTTYELGREKIDLIKRTVAKGATDLELELFLHACKRTGLDPLMKQIHAIKRWSQAEGREVMSIQTGIDGYRLIADRTGQYAGSDEPVFMVGDDGYPDVASVTVYKLVGGLKCAFTHSVRWKEYVQTKKDGTPTSFWNKMPFGQLGKCAESGALRKAFPAELSGVYTHDEMMQDDHEPERKPLPKGAEMLAKIEEKASVVVNAADVLARSEDAMDTAELTEHHVPKDTFPVPDIFAQSSAIADHELAIEEAGTMDELQKAWNDCVADKLLTSETRSTIYKRMTARAKTLKSTIGNK